MGRYFILSEGTVSEEPDYEAWSKWYENAYEGVSNIAHTETAQGTVTTKFTAMSMTLDKKAAPMVFETTVSGGWLDGKIERYPTVEEAKKGHDSWVEKVKKEEDENVVPPPGAGW
ncbi:MAG: hypothetical protein GY906_14840 [bacterium]|nr:hypothetical protein [bacterium]